jgi:predicted nucleic acid-binding protein
MAFGVVLDTCTLYPFSLCDILLRLAERELYDVYWSERILEELERNLRESRLTEEQAARRVGAIREAFPAAMVPNEAIASLEPAMTNHEKDRHVLAATVASPAEAVVTFNLGDFSEESRDPHHIDLIHPDEFLVSLYELDPNVVRGAIEAQSAALKNPPISVSELVGMLAQAGVPEFAKQLTGGG